MKTMKMTKKVWKVLILVRSLCHINCYNLPNME